MYNSIYPQQGGVISPYNQVAFQQQQQRELQPQVLKGRPVSSFDEANASMIDLDGSMFIFPDIAGKKIYTKQILLDGRSELKTYALVDQSGSATEESVHEYVLRQDYDKAIKRLTDKITKLTQEVGKYAKHGANDGADDE